MNITLTVVVPLLFQLIASTICPGNQTIAPGVNYCQVLTQDAVRPDKVDVQFLDMAAGQYMTTQWLATDTVACEPAGTVTETVTIGGVTTESQIPESECDVIATSTMLTRVEALDGSCYSWLNDDWEATTTCDFNTNP